MDSPTLLQRLRLPIVLAVIMVVLWAASYHAFRNLADSPLTIEEPARSLGPSEENLGSVLAVANRGHAPLFQRQLSVPHRDVPAFLNHLDTAAPQRGWFVHNGTYHDAVLIMPAEELTDLDELARNPVGWVKAENQSITSARGPSTLNLITVGLWVNREGEVLHRIWRFIGFVGLVLSGILFTVALMLTVDQVRLHRWHAKHPVRTTPGKYPGAVRERTTCN